MRASLWDKTVYYPRPSSEKQLLPAL